MDMTAVTQLYCQLHVMCQLHVSAGVNPISPYYHQELQRRDTSRLPPPAYDTPLIPPAIMANIMKS